jgi:hypothetical protein
MLEIAKSQTQKKSYLCNCCDYNTCNKFDYEKHMQTIKHKSNFMAINGNILSQKSQTNEDTKLFTCQPCNKSYKDYSGLWKHKKKCCTEKAKELIKTKEPEKTKEPTDKELIMMLIKENSEFKTMVIKVLENGTNNTTNNNTNTNCNNSFNLNFYLNETCKNAMNITDFISQLNVGIKDLEETGRLGFSEGISKIFLNGLKEIDVTDRPIHCSDIKRETLYIKEDNEWIKDNENKAILTNAIKNVAHKNIKQIKEWQKLYPEFNDPDSKQNDKYLKIVCESMSGSSQEETNKNYNKIIKNIVKETIIDKEPV